jgi:indole-3-glycerol phosphate synthase
MPEDILSEIIAAKQKRVAAAKLVRPVEQLRDEARVMRSAAVRHALAGALSQFGSINVIAEFKRKSPSKGLIIAGADPQAMARAYESGGAAAISVLTEEDYFAGSLDDFALVRSTTALPLLRKDFICDEYQVYESAAAGADALLLIVAALDDDLLPRLRHLAEDELGLDALVEVHTSAEMKRAVAAGATLIGVNNRDLRTFNVSLTTSIELAKEATEDSLLVSESGLHNAEDLHRLRTAGYRGFLIGETLMRAERADLALRKLTGTMAL